MPRLTTPTFGYKISQYKKFINYKPRIVKYKVLLPPILADKVSSKKEKSKGAECLQEMTVMMNCWKDKDFSPDKCAKEIEAFQKCSAAAAAAQAKKQELMKKGIFTAEGGRLPPDRLNKLLGRYPQPPHRYK